LPTLSHAPDSALPAARQRRRRNLSAPLARREPHHVASLILNQYGGVIRLERPRFSAKWLADYRPVWLVQKVVRSSALARLGAALSKYASRSRSSSGRRTTPAGIGDCSTSRRSAMSLIANVLRVASGSNSSSFSAVSPTTRPVSTWPAFVSTCVALNTGETC